MKSPFRPYFIIFSKTVFYEVNLVSQCLHLEVLLLSKFGSERGISIDADSGPLGYVLWCCGSRSQDFFTFIQISSGHTVQKQPTSPFITYYCRFFDKVTNFLASCHFVTFSWYIKRKQLIFLFVQAGM